MQKIIPCIWFDHQAEEAINFYTSLFQKSKITQTMRYDEDSAKASGMPEGSVLTMSFELEGIQFMALNGGPFYKLTPAISFSVGAETIEEVDRLRNALSIDGKVMMELQEYPFSKRYGWIQDKYGVSWQISITNDFAKQKIIPSLLFVQGKLGKAQEAIQQYTSIFSDGKIQFTSPNHERPETIDYGLFSLAGQEFVAMDGPGNHAFDFTGAISFVVNCETQEEIDMFWNALSTGGAEEQCGRLKDKYGISRQIVPTMLDKLLQDPDAAKAKRTMQAMLGMVKLDIAKLQAAHDG